jgi:hypothetical protein
MCFLVCLNHITKAKCVSFSPLSFQALPQAQRYGDEELFQFLNKSSDGSTTTAQRIKLVGTIRA